MIPACPTSSLTERSWSLTERSPLITMYVCSERSSLPVVGDPLYGGAPPPDGPSSFTVEHQLLNPKSHYKMRSINPLRVDVPKMSPKKGDAGCRPEGGLSPQTRRMVARTRELAANLNWKGQ